MRSKAPAVTPQISYETAASLLHIMCAAYVEIQKTDPKLYEEIMAQTKRFFEFLDAYVTKYS